MVYGLLMNLFLLLLQFYKKRKEIYLRQGSIIRYAAPPLGLTGGRIKFDGSPPASLTRQYRLQTLAGCCCYLFSSVEVTSQYSVVAF